MWKVGWFLRNLALQNNLVLVEYSIEANFADPVFNNKNFNFILNVAKF